MKRWGMLCILLLPAAVSAQQVVRQRALTVQLDVNAQGQVSDAKVMGRMVPDASRHGFVLGKEALPESLAKAISQVAGTWRFKAPERDGRPVSGRTYVRTTMKILKMANGSYRMDLEYLRNGPMITFMPALRYPQRMRRLGREAVVVVEATVRPDGEVTGARAVKVFTASAGSGRHFAKTALDAVGKWKGIPMKLDGHAVATRMRTAIYFQLSGARNLEKDYGKKVDALLGSDSGSDRSPAAPRPNAIVAMDTPFVKQPSG